MWFIASHQLRESCGVNQARNYGFVFLPYFSQDSGWQTWLAATWEVTARLPDPPKFPELEGELPEPMARSLHFLGVNDDVLLVTYLDHGVMCVYVDQLQLYSTNSTAALIEHGTWKLWKLDGAYALDPVRCMTQLFLAHQRNLTSCNFIQRLFRGFPKSEDSCRDQPVRRHRLVFTWFQSLHGHPLPKHNTSHHLGKCHSPRDVRSQWRCCAFRNINGLCSNN